MRHVKELNELEKQIAEYIVSNPNATQRKVAAVFNVNEKNLNAKLRSDRHLQEEIDRLRHEKFKGLTAKAIQVIDNLLDQNDFKAALFVLENTGYKMNNKIAIEAANNIMISIVDGDITATPVIDGEYEEQQLLPEVTSDADTA